MTKSKRTLVLVGAAGVLVSASLHASLYFWRGYRSISIDRIAGLDISRSFALNAVAGLVIAELLVLAVRFDRLAKPAAAAGVLFTLGALGDQRERVDDRSGDLEGRGDRRGPGARHVTASARGRDRRTAGARRRVTAQSVSATSAAMATVWAMSSSVWANDTNVVSYPLGARYTPRSSMPWKNFA